ncbi:hypothetical protein Btru_026435 [Bulinus truncatus]|nr:hypothetical protein Btru_026435 [Bulinus truncatus]
MFVVLLVLILSIVELKSDTKRFVTYDLTSLISGPVYNYVARGLNILEEHRGISLLDSAMHSHRSKFLGAALHVRNSTSLIPRFTAEDAIAVQRNRSTEEMTIGVSGLGFVSAEGDKVLITTANMTRLSTPRLTSTTSTTPIPHMRYMVDLTDGSHYDPFIKTVMESRSRCHNASSYDAIMAVHTAPGNVGRRQAFRWMYTDPEKTKPHKIKLFFFIGLVENSTLQTQLMKEQDEFGDLVQGSFVDAYVNLTYKAVFLFKWLSENCPGLRLLLRLDDDVFMLTQQFFRDWSALVGNRTNTITCDTESNDRVRRDGKWSVNRSDMAEDRYLFQHCLGYFVALTPDLVPKMDAAARKTHFFWIDDIFMYGIVAKKVGVEFVKMNSQMPRWREGKFVACLKDHGNRCKLLTLITKPEKRFKYLYSLIQHHTERTKL